MYRGVSIHCSNLKGQMSVSRLIESVLLDTKYTLKAYSECNAMSFEDKNIYLKDLKRPIQNMQMSRTITFAPLCSSPSAPPRAIYYCTYCGKSGMKLHKAIDFCTPITDDCFLNTWVQLEALRYIHQSQKPEPLKISPIYPRKITEKVSISIASEASYVYILQKFIKMTKMVPFDEFLKT